MKEAITVLGNIVLFFIDAVRLIWKQPYRIAETIHQLEFVANKSVGIVVVTGLFTGLVFSYQAYLGFSIVNATNLVGPTAALGIARELGPVLTGLIIAARAGGAMAAQLGTMRVTEQIDALQVMGVSSRQYLVTPRIVAAIIGTPLLTGLFVFFAMIGTYVLCIHILELDEAIFWDKIAFWLNPRDINEGLMKGAIFGLIFSSICTYMGYNTEGGAKGVGDATNRGVVVSMVTIIVIDYFVTKLWRMGLRILNV